RACMQARARQGHRRHAEAGQRYVTKVHDAVTGLLRTCCRERAEAGKLTLKPPLLPGITGLLPMVPLPEPPLPLLALVESALAPEDDAVPPSLSQSWVTPGAVGDALHVSHLLPGRR